MAIYKKLVYMFLASEYVSFANCGLPYYIGEKIKSKSNLVFQTPESFYNRYKVDVRNFTEVIKIEPNNKTITVKNLETGNIYTENYDKLILSMGSKPIKLPIEGIDNDNVFSLRDIPDAIKIKNYIKKSNIHHVVVAGGGYIGLEMVENLINERIKVTIVELADYLIQTLDVDMSVEVEDYLNQNGVDVITNNGIKKIEKNMDKLLITLDNKKIEACMLIMSVGITPESELAKEANIKVNSKGAIIVDEHLQTSEKDIFAIGDVIEVTNFITKTKASMPLAGPANKQGRIVADIICGIDSIYAGTQGSAILKLFDLTVATTGINEKTAKENNYDYDKVFLTLKSHADYYPGAYPMTIKVIFDNKSGKILGGQLIGFDGVDKRTDVLATAIKFNADAHDLTQLELCYSPPFNSAKDPINIVGYSIENIISGRVKQIHWHDIKKLPKDGSVNLLDVRTEYEFEMGSIERFINIPLDSIRDNLEMINKNKPVYIHCLSGQRSYMACMILSGLGYDCYNISGGYKLYKKMKLKNRV